MERQKIFWVVLAVGVFVVVVLVVGVFLLRQKPQAGFASATPTVTPLSDTGTQVYEYQRESPTASSGQPGTGQPGGGTETMHFYIGEGQQQGTTGQAGQSGQAGQPGGPAGTTGTPSTAAPSGSGTPQPAGATQAAPAAAPSAKRTIPGLGAPAAARTAAAARPAPRSTEYWIQTGSYKSQTKAEDLASLLGDKGLSGRVFSYASQGSTWYRVRVGPYASRGEADRFLAEVKKLQGMESSFISQVAPPKTPVN